MNQIGNYELYDMIEPADKDSRPYLFMVEVPGYNNFTITSLIRKVEFYRDEIIIDYIDDKNHVIHNAFNHYTLEWKLHYLDREGEVKATFRIRSVCRVDLPPTVCHDYTGILINKMSLGSVSTDKKIPANIGGKKVRCLECYKTADYIRHTQFSGDHPFCEEHAKKEKDFGEKSGYTVWEKLNDTKI